MGLPREAVCLPGWRMTVGRGVLGRPVVSVSRSSREPVPLDYDGHTCFSLFPPLGRSWVFLSLAELVRLRKGPCYG